MDIRTTPAFGQITPCRCVILLKIQSDLTDSSILKLLKIETHLESIDGRTEEAADEAERLLCLLLEVLGEVGRLLNPAEHLYRSVPQKVHLNHKYQQ
jgi:hypothetical protein